MESESPRRESPLSIARKWLPWCLALIFGMTAGWTALIALEELSGGNHDGIVPTVIAVVSGTAPATPLIVLYAILITSALDFGGGFAVVTARYLTEKFLDPWRQKRREEAAKALEIALDEARAEARAEALAEGSAEERGKWTDWNHRRMEAEANGTPFDEPPPGAE